MERKSMFFKLLLPFCAMLLLSPYLMAATDASIDTPAIREKVEKVLQQLDSSAFAAQVSNDEFIVKAYLLVNGHKPDAFEFYYCQSLFNQNKLTRSNLLALLLAGADNEITWNECQTLLGGNPANYLKNTSDIQQDVHKLKNSSQETILRAYKEQVKSRQTQTDLQDTSTFSSVPATSASKSTSMTVTTPNESYNTYFGYLHAHTSYSDGKGTPSEAYQYARDFGKLDFFAVTDHGEMIVAWPWQKKWAKIKAAAEDNYVAGSFVTLWGFEWSNPLLGHINIINTSDYSNCLSNVGLGDIYNWLEARTDGFGIYNHPGSYDSLNIEFEHLEMTESEVIPQMVGIETWNGSNSFDQYYYKNNWNNSNYSYLDTGNLNSWLLGALGGQDNHDKSWGVKNQFRTAVLAQSLTREGIMEAYRNRRFYATEDSDLHLDFRCCGYPMGSQITNVSRYFTVTANDGSGDTFNKIRFYRNGNLIATQSVSGSMVYATFTDYETIDAAYYYVIVTENDDNDANGRNDEAISSAIWIQ